MLFLIFDLAHQPISVLEHGGGLLNGLSAGHHTGLAVELMVMLASQTRAGLELVLRILASSPWSLLEFWKNDN